MLDTPLQLLIGVVATALFAWRGDSLWFAKGKGALVSVFVTTILGVLRAVTAGTTRAAVVRRNLR